MSQPDTIASFIRASEVWLPQGETLVFGGGDYGSLEAFADVSAQAQFAHGEGLPGTAWAEGRPIVLDRFEIWDTRPERVGPRRAAMRIDGICERDGPLWPRQNPPVDIVTIGEWQGPVGQVLGHGLPHIVGNGTGLPAGYGSMIALPVYRGEDLAFITAWYL